MRCQPGDLALVVRGHEQSVGHMVTCVRLLTPGETIVIGGFDVPCRSLKYDTWVLDTPVVWTIDFNGMMLLAPAPYCSDYCLQPIRPERDEDHDLTQAASDELARRLNPTFFGSITEPTT